MRTRLTYSLNKRKNWLRVPAILNSGVECDEARTVSFGKEQRQEETTTKLAYFDLERMQQDALRRARRQQKYDATLDYAAGDIGHFVRDKFYHSIKRKEHRLALKHWQRAQSAKPR